VACHRIEFGTSARLDGRQNILAEVEGDLWEGYVYYSDLRRNIPALKFRNAGMFILTTQFDLSRKKFEKKSLAGC
jgi:hypothetical protein